MPELTKRITPYSFRHTHASQLIETNVNMKVISLQIGHSSLATADETDKRTRKKDSHQFSELMKDLRKRFTGIDNN